MSKKVIIVVLLVVVGVAVASVVISKYSKGQTTKCLKCPSENCICVEKKSITTKTIPKASCTKCTSGKCGN